MPYTAETKLDMDKLGKDHVNLPMPPELNIKENNSLASIEAGDMQHEIYAVFMKCLRQVQNSRSIVKVLAAIQNTADYLGLSDAYVTKILVDLGLRAPRRAFPKEFLDFTDRKHVQIDTAGQDAALSSLFDHWRAHGESRFTAFYHADYALPQKTVFVD